jgi:hypothetical protein
MSWCMNSTADLATPCQHLPNPEHELATGARCYSAAAAAAAARRAGGGWSAKLLERRPGPTSHLSNIWTPVALVRDETDFFFRNRAPMHPLRHCLTVTRHASRLFRTGCRPGCSCATITYPESVVPGSTPSLHASVSCSTMAAASTLTPQT